MVKAKDAISTARKLIGTPYSELDCIALIREIIKKTSGGYASYRCEGTNWLWRSIGNSGKYRHLTWRQENISGARPGMLTFKANGDDIHHVGLVTDNGTVIHSSSVYGKVIETTLDSSWHYLGQHRYIEVADTVVELPEDLPECSEPVGEPGAKGVTTLIRDDGTIISMVGDWRVAED